MAALIRPHCALQPPSDHFAPAPRGGCGGLFSSLASAGGAGPRASPRVALAAGASTCAAAVAPPVVPVPPVVSATGRAQPLVSGARCEYHDVCRHASAPDIAAEPEPPSLPRSNTAPQLLERASGPQVRYDCGGMSRTTGARPAASPREQPTCRMRKLVSVVAPGGGTLANGAVYSELARSSRLKVEILGRARAEYDQYPEAFDGGSPPPNFDSGAFSVNHALTTGVSKLALRPRRLIVFDSETSISASAVARTAEEESDCLVVGSRGGQVALPHLWKKAGAATPPAVIINGGCAMQFPEAPCWPDEAAPFLLAGGCDNFRG
ncbi:unnamed protein product, partial [Prorocentrum cordatum]